RVHH
ncbi:hypothetical protein EC950183_4003, partial [Escherichia coli 95.0183]